jgi:hypothetical protein
MQASDSVFDGLTKISSKPLEVKLDKGQIDLRGYELVRSQFLSPMGQITVLISESKILFNKVAVMKIPDADKIELLVYPEKRLIGVRKAPPESRFAMEWKKTTDKGAAPKEISGSAFIPTLYRMFSWNIDTHYKITGSVHKCGDEYALVFRAEDAVLSLDKYDFENIENVEIMPESEKQFARRKRIMAFPKEWADSFGEDYYESYAREQTDTEDSIGDGHSAFAVDDTTVTTQKQAADEIKNILQDIGVKEDE